MMSDDYLLVTNDPVLRIVAAGNSAEMLRECRKMIVSDGKLVVYQKMEGV